MFNLLFLVSYGEINDTTWKFDHSKLENHQSFLKSNDIINLNLKKMYDNNGTYIRNGQNGFLFLRSHDIQFTIG